MRMMCTSPGVNRFQTHLRDAGEVAGVAVGTYAPATPAREGRRANLHTGMLGWGRRSCRQRALPLANNGSDGTSLIPTMPRPCHLADMFDSGHCPTDNDARSQKHDTKARAAVPLTEATCTWTGLKRCQTHLKNVGKVDQLPPRAHVTVPAMREGFCKPAVFRLQV